MHDERPVVEQDPVQVVEALDAHRLRAALGADLLLDLLGDRGDLSGIAAARDDELLGDREHIAHLETRVALPLLVVSDARGSDRPELRLVIHRTGFGSSRWS